MTEVDNTGQVVGSDITLGQSLPYGIAATATGFGYLIGDGDKLIFRTYDGNANHNTSVRATGPVPINDYSNVLAYLGSPTAVQTNVYVSQDFNMDGNVRVTGPPAINDYSKLLNILGVITNVISEQL